MLRRPRAFDCHRFTCAQGRPDVAAGTREAVLQAARELGFSSNRSARALSGGRTSLIGVTVPLVDIEYFSRIVAGVADALFEHDLQIVLAPTLHLRDRAATSLARLTNGSTDGAVLILPEESNAELAALMQTGYPLGRRPYRAARRRRAHGLGGERPRRSRRDRASALAGASPHRRYHWRR